MGRLAEELKKRFRRPQDALKALGLPEDLLSPAQLAKDSRMKRGRDGMADEAEAEEMKAARNLSGSAFEDEQLRINRQMEHEMADDDEEEPEREDDDGEAEMERRRRNLRRHAMRNVGEDCLRDGMSLDEVRERLADWPRPATSGGFGGALAEDTESKLGEDVDWTMRQLEATGGTETSEYRREPKVEDKRMAKDRALAERSFQEFYPEASRLDGDAVSTRYGDRPTPMAMDQQSADNAADFDAFFPEARRIGIA